MSPTEHDWLRQIAADRDNDALRLIFADWLEEHGDAARAEFIRVQVRLATLPDSPEYWGLRKRATDLHKKHSADWLRDVWVAPRNQCEFRRGFVEAITCTSTRWLQGADRAVRACPLLQSLTLRLAKADHVVKLASLPQMAGLSALALKGGFVNVTEEGVRALVSSPYLMQLTTLDLLSREIGNAGAAALAASPSPPHLNVLNLGHNSIGSAGASALAASPYLKRLTTLDLGANNISDVGASALAASPRLSRLTELHLNSNWIRDEGASALASSPYLKRLNHLELYGNRISDAGASALADSPHLRQIKKISLDHNPISEMAKEALRKRFGTAVLF